MSEDRTPYTVADNTGLTEGLDAPIGNYYGSPYVGRRDGRPVFGIGDHSSSEEVVVSEEFFAAFVAEFNRPSPDDVF